MQTSAAPKRSNTGHVGFIDLEGNARLVVDEVFIGKRSCHRVGAPVAEEMRSA